MANPNLLNATSIYGKTAYQSGSSSTQTILTCATDKLIKILTMNIHSDGSNNWHRIYIAGKQVSGGGSLNDNPPQGGQYTLGSFYLTEGQTVKFQGDGSGIDCVISYEEIDDA